MKKIVVLVMGLMAFYSCDSDDEPIATEKQLVKVERQYEASGDISVVNYDGDSKVISAYSHGVLTNEFSYNSDGFIINFTSYSSYSSEINEKYDFNYNAAGEIVSFHHYEDRGFFDPIDQDRTVTWVGNTMRIPLMDQDTVDEDDYDLYEFTFNDNDLLTNLKITKSNGDVELDVTYEYDANENPIRFNGVIDFYGTYNVDVEMNYDANVNPYHKYYKKNYVQYIIITGKIYGMGVFGLGETIYHYGKNNYTTSHNLIGEDSPYSPLYEYSYDGDYPVVAELKNNLGELNTTITYTYQE